MEAGKLRNLQAQLLAIRQQAVTLQQQALTMQTQAEALLHLLDGEDTEQVTTPDGVCQHPRDKRKDLSTFGARRFKCLACGVTVEAEGGGGVGHGG